MSGNPPPTKQSATWLSNILRPRASSISVEACLNLSSRDPSQPLDARPILPLLEPTQPLASRCKHLLAFSDICKNYRFTHLENVFFTVQDILEPAMPQEARHTVFEFMLACIVGQYADLGMARVTFYALLRNYALWDDFGDMYRVLFALCKGGRDISGFEKNVCKLLIHWLQQPALKKQPYLGDVLHLLTVIAKFNFALFEEEEVTQMILAIHQAFFSSQHADDMQACLEFADIVVRYRFVPFDALTPFLEMLAASVMLLPTTHKTSSTAGALVSCWPIFLNLLRSHCAHSAILTLCRFLDKEPSKSDNLLIKGAIALLSETAWGKNSKTGAETYMVSDSVILMYLKRAANKDSDTINSTLLDCLMTLVESPENNDLGLMEWEAVWDIVDVITRYILKMTDNNSNYDVQLFNHSSPSDCQCIRPFSRFSQVVIQLHKDKRYKGPMVRFIQVLYQLRGYCDDDTAHLLLDYYVTEHAFLPSTEHWLPLLQHVTHTFFIHTNPNTCTPAIRLKMLTIVTNVCVSVKDFYSELMYENIVIPMMQKLHLEQDVKIRQTAIDLIVSSLSDCQNESIFDRLMVVLRKCATCQCTTEDLQQQQQKSTRQRTPQKPLFVTDTATDSFFDMDHHCMGFPAMMGISELFENLLLASNGKLCCKTFDVITDIANDAADLSCPYGGPKIVALDLLLRLRCPTNHHIYLIEDSKFIRAVGDHDFKTDSLDLQEENSVIAYIRSQQQHKRQETERKKSQDSFMPGPAMKATAVQPTTNTKPVFYPSPHLFSYSESKDDIVLNINEMLQSFIKVLSDSPNWVVILFLLKRLPQQLSNKHLFCGASPSINKLRRLLVRWTSTRKFLENMVNLPPHIKRNDLNVYAYSLLTVLISYRRVFTEPKQDQDEIVYAFYVGIMQVTPATRLCINALAVCCHELPLSVAKMLNEILQRMSQIISVSSVSVHILEFLNGLARLPNLYANFTGDMYKPVFAIALNYLQHSHSQQQQPSPLNTPSASPLMSSGVSTNVAASPTLSIAAAQREASQGALKQYVLIMAYLVITVWFTAIPLRERRKHVPFIIQRLLSGISMGKPIDEQTYTCIDMLSRFTFADVGLAPEKSIVSKILMGDGDHNVSSSKQSQRTWVYGHTLLTLRTAKSLGWVEVTIRRPSGTVSMMCHVENKIKSEDIDYRTLPALLMMQYQPDLMAYKILKDREQVDKMEAQETYIKPEPEQEGSALGITFNEEEGKRFPTGAATRRPSDQAVVSATIATRSEGLVMAPSVSSEQVPVSPAATSSASISPVLTRRPSLSQKGLLGILQKDSETTETPKPAEDIDLKKAEKAVHVIMSDPTLP
ncbi:Tuberous sclerosis 2-like protein, partial [Rhizopus stolonifer]